MFVVVSSIVLSSSLLIIFEWIVGGRRMKPGTSIVRDKERKQNQWYNMYMKKRPLNIVNTFLDLIVRVHDENYLAV